MYVPFHSTEQVVDQLNEVAHAGNNRSWFLCISDIQGEAIPELLKKAQQADLSLYGAIFPGLIYADQVHKTGLIARPLSAGSTVIEAKLDKGGIQWNKPLPTQPGDQFNSSMLFVDCLAPGISQLMESIYDQFGNSIKHFGAGAGYHDLSPQPVVFGEKGLVEHGALLILCPLHATVGVRHGWHRAAGPFVASRTTGNIIQELNWEPAGSYYRQLVVERNPELANRPVFPDLMSMFPLCIAKEGGEDVLRDPIMLSEDDEILVLSDVAENSVMYLAQGDHDSIIEAAASAAEECGTPDSVEHCFLSDCFSRSLILEEKFSDELKAAGRVLSRFSRVIPEGVLAMGEVANNGNQYLELFNKTFVMAVSHR